MRRWSAAVPHLSPGEITLADNGVLFLDELPEFGRDVLEALRQPLEEGRVAIARAGRATVFPARFQLVAAMNPCPCGFAGTSDRPCSCPVLVPARYQRRVSGPLRDRIDLWVAMPRSGGARDRRRARAGDIRGRGAEDRRGAGDRHAADRRDG
jgi:magnesium chelatase family protein